MIFDITKKTIYLLESFMNKSIIIIMDRNYNVDLTSLTAVKSITDMINRCQYKNFKNFRLKN